MFFFCFVFEKISSSLPVSLVMLFVDVRTLSNTRSQMFFKTGVLKNFAIFIATQIPTQIFSFEYCLIFKGQLLYRTSVYYTFLKFFVMIEIRYFSVFLKEMFISFLQINTTIQVSLGHIIINCIN